VRLKLYNLATLAHSASNGAGGVATAHTGRQTALPSSAPRNIVQTREGIFVLDCKESECVVAAKGQFRCDVGGICEVNVDCLLTCVTVEWPRGTAAVVLNFGTKLR